MFVCLFVCLFAWLCVCLFDCLFVCWFESPPFCVCPPLPRLFVSASHVCGFRLAKLHTGRIMSDLYAKGQQKMSSETTKLLLDRCPWDKTLAECFKSSPTVPFHGARYFSVWGQALRGNVCITSILQGTTPDRTSIQLDKRFNQNFIVNVPQVEKLYGVRGDHVLVRTLSPYEFQTSWQVALIC